MRNVKSLIEEIRENYKGYTVKIYDLMGNKITEFPIEKTDIQVNYEVSLWYVENFFDTEIVITVNTANTIISYHI